SHRPFRTTCAMPPIGPAEGMLMDDPSELQVEANAVPSEQLRSAESRADAGPEPPGRSLLLVLTRCGVVALPSESIVEVLTAAPLARLPGARVEVAGVVNRRG